MQIIQRLVILMQGNWKSIEQNCEIFDQEDLCPPDALETPA